MELKDLISGPLVATIDADTISSRRYLQYLFDLAFESYDPITGKVGAMRMLRFDYTAADVGGKRKQQITVPILTLVPLPLLQIQEADFDFDINVIDALSADSYSTYSLSEGKQQAGEGSKLRVALSPTKIEANTSDSSLKQGLSANMKVRVKMRQADLPGGVANILNLTTNNLLIEDVEEEQNQTQDE